MASHGPADRWAQCTAEPSRACSANAYFAASIVDGDHAASEKWVTEYPAHRHFSGCADGAEIHDPGLRVVQYRATNAHLAQLGLRRSDHTAGPHTGNVGATIGQLEQGRRVLTDYEVAGPGIHDEVKRALPIHEYRDDRQRPVRCQPERNDGVGHAATVLMGLEDGAAERAASDPAMRSG